MDIHEGGVGAPASPVRLIDTDTEGDEPEAGIALCLSGGGYRAMLFHVGSLWRLNEAGYLRRLARISSVSGGSITAGVLGRNWARLGFDGSGVGQNFSTELVKPIREFAGRSIDAKAIAGGMFLPGTAAERVVAAYREHLYGDATLQDLPDTPRFVINATNVQSGALWRFSKPYMADWRVGEVKSPKVSLAVAVAASSAFPPVLSPLEMEAKESDYTPGSGKDLQVAPYTTDIVLSDGGVYDNLGIETAWKRYKTILVSDAGGKMPAEAEPERDWARHALRVLDLVDNQVRSLRKRQVIDSFIAKTRDGAYWGIRTNIQDYGLAQTLSCPFSRTMELASTPTRLKRLDSDVQERLINWGYAVCDAALRKHVNIALPMGQFPHSIGV